GIPKHTGGPRVRVDMGSAEPDLPETDDSLESANQAVRDAIAAAEASSQGTGGGSRASAAPGGAAAPADSGAATEPAEPSPGPGPEGLEDLGAQGGPEVPEDGRPPEPDTL